MSAGVVLKIDSQEDRDGWKRVLEAFQVEAIYQLPGLGFRFPESIDIERLQDLHNYTQAPIVIVQPDFGDFVQGEIRLDDFDHPPQALYVFGGTVTRLTDFDVAGARIHAKVFIPTTEFFPSQAGAITLWDRKLKGAPT